MFVVSFFVVNGVVFWCLFIVVVVVVAGGCNHFYGSRHSPTNPGREASVWLSNALLRPTIGYRVLTKNEGGEMLTKRCLGAEWF